MKIEELLNKYFEGETSCEEERELRSFFAGSNVPEELKVYIPLFAYIEQEALQYKKQINRKKDFPKHLMYAISGIAACLLIVLSTNIIYKHSNSTPRDYVIIDGKRYTDTDLIREHAQIAFNDVCFTREELFETLFE